MGEFLQFLVKTTSISNCIKSAVVNVITTFAPNSAEATSGSPTYQNYHYNYKLPRLSIAWLGLIFNKIAKMGFD